MKHLKIGDPAPTWSGKNELGNMLESKDFLGKKTVIYFYPKDSTPACTNQACNLRDHYTELLKNGIQVIGVSADSEKMHQKFIEKQSLPFPLIADEEKNMIQTFGVWGEKKFMGKIYDGIHRTTFLIDEKGIILDILEKPNTKAHAEEILESFAKK
ncbi:MAG: thioredoxin-dependent thiol peroxidase [Crocinitomicaceae bacterium]